MARRKRFDFEYEEDGETKSMSILGFSEASARRYIEEAGFRILSFNKKVKATWQIDEQALAEAVRLLKLKWPIKITRTTSRSSHGQHALHLKARFGTPAHYITASKAASVYESSRVLWHELCHAMQAERAGGNFSTLRLMQVAWGDELASQRDLPYDERSYEVEAKTYEQAAEFFRLTKPC